MIKTPVLARPFVWEKLGRILKPDPSRAWMSTFTGASFAMPVEAGTLCDIYVTGRDDKNRSQIGSIRIDLTAPDKILRVSALPLLPLGEPGAFDENGVSYPALIRHSGKTWMYYVGWMPTVLTPYQTHIGLAAQEADGTFRRVSRAPILDRTDDDALGMGSVCVLQEKGHFRMWYTSYLKWGTTPQEPKHTYVIKYAESADGIRWERAGQVCIGLEKEGEFAICRPSVMHTADGYRMWYATRGRQYRIGYAESADGIQWTRRDDLSGISPSDSGWDSEAVTYPHVFTCGGEQYLLYNGNDYGREGLGLARLKK